MSIWDDVKTVPIDQVASRLGIIMPKRGSMRCPFPDHDDRDPSFSIIRKSNSCYCHGCQRGGSVIDLVLHFRGCSATDAVEWLSSNFMSGNSGAYGRFKSSERPIAKAQTKASDDSEYRPNPALYADFLAANQMSDDGRSYLTSRGISAKTAAKFGIGYIADAPAALRSLLRAADLTSVSKSGLIFDGRRIPRLTFPSRSLVFPFFEKGEIIYLQARTIDSNAKNRWIGLNRITKPIYNTDAIHSARNVHVCEGCLDVLSAAELRRTAIGLTGADTKLTSSVLRALRNKTVYIVPDEDPPGKRMAEQTLATLRKSGIQAVVQHLPFGKDLNEYLMLKRARS